jgi:hypothetical protein
VASIFLTQPLPVHSCSAAHIDSLLSEVVHVSEDKHLLQ